MNIMKKPIEAGMKFYNERNGDYVTTLSYGCNNRCWYCEVEELGEDGEYKVAPRALYMEYELRLMKEVEK